MTILLPRALLAQHLPPHARACSTRLGATGRSILSALHVAYFSGGSLTALGFLPARRCTALPLYVTAHHIHTIPAAQTAIDHQPSSQCRQASWMPPRQGRQPPSGRCALGLPPPPRCCRSQHAHPPAPLGRSCLLPPWPALGHHAPTGGLPVRPSCPCCQPVSQYPCIPHRLALHVVAFSLRA